MKVTRERKIYAAVLGLVVLGFALDRTIYGGAKDLVEESASPDSAIVPATGPAASATLSDEPSLAARLSSAVGDPAFDPAAIREPFTRQLPWIALAPTAAIEGGPNLAEQFASRHTLTATMGAGQQNGIAIIDGNCVRIGKSFDGFRLTSVDRHSALLESNGTRVKLALKSDVALGQ